MTSSTEFCFKSSRPKFFSFLRAISRPCHRLTVSMSFLVFFVIVSSLFPLCSSSSSGCTSVRVAYGALGLDSSAVPETPIAGADLRACASSHTCCTPAMETELSARSKKTIEDAISGSIGHLHQTYTYTVKFHSFFNQLLDAAEYDLNKMFVTTYGLLYQQNSHVFTDLFSDLRSYYRGTDGIILSDALDNFFATLLQKMFQLLNAQYYLDELYLACVSDTMDELQPFGDVPGKLISTPTSKMSFIHK